MRITMETKEATEIPPSHDSGIGLNGWPSDGPAAWTNSPPKGPGLYVMCSGTIGERTAMHLIEIYEPVVGVLAMKPLGVPIQLLRPEALWIGPLPEPPKP